MEKFSIPDRICKAKVTLGAPGSEPRGTGPIPVGSFQRAEGLEEYLDSVSWAGLRLGLGGVPVIV